MLVSVEHVYVILAGMASQIKDQAQHCEVWNDFLARQQKEPLMTHKIPESPGSKVRQDLFAMGLRTI